MIIRKALLEDIPAITNLGESLTALHKGFDPEYYTFDEEGFSASFSDWLNSQIPLPSSLFLVSIENGKVIGFLSGFIKYLFPWYKIKKVGHISFTMIDENFRGRGIGRSLFFEAAGWFKQQDLNYIELYANEKNSMGLEFWKSCGFSDFQKFLRKKI